METKFGDRPRSDASIPSPQSEAVVNELQGLTLQPGHNLLPITKRRSILQLKLQQRRTREELVNQGIMPPLKSSAAFHKQRRSLERARTEDYLKRKIRSRPERSELIRMHILEETSAEPSLQAKQLQLKKARLADDLNDKISHRPGPMELFHKNILPVHSSIKQAIIETQFSKASGDILSGDEDSNDSLSPEQPVSQESPLDLGALPSPPETLAGSVSSPTQALPPPPHLPSLSGSSPSLKLTNGTATSAQRMDATSQIKSQPKPNSDRSSQRHKKLKDNKPKIKKLKYHQYIPPDQKGDKEPPPHLDSSYAKILQQQQLFLQLQILSQQQQHYNYHTILPAPPNRTQTDQQPSSSSTSTSMTTTSPPQPVTAPSNQSCHSRQGSAPLGGTKPVSLPPNLDEMKVAELKSELKLRNLPVSGTKNDLIERLRTYQELNGGSDTTSSPLAGGPTGPGTEGAGKPFRTAAATTSKQQHQCQQTSSLTGDACSSAPPPTATPEQLTTCVGTASSPPASLTPSDHSPPAMSPEDNSFNSDLLGEMVSSPPTQLGLQSGSAAQLPLNIKEESPCSTPAPCQFSFTPSSLQKQYPVTSAAHTTRTTTPLVTVDKDKMLQEKDKQIQELTRMLRQKQRLVEVLRMQLEHGKKGGRVPDPVVLVRVKQEPPDKPNSPLPSSVPCGMDVTKVNIKQEAIEAEEAVSETTVQSPDFHGFPQFSNRAHEVQEQILMHSKPEQRKQEQHVCLQQTTLRLAQQQAIHELLLQQQHNIQNHSQTPENQQNLQKRSQQRKKKPQKQQQKQQLVKSQQGHQQMQLKQQILLKQQKSLLQQQIKQHQQQTKQPQQIQIQTKIHLKQQQVLIQQNQKVQQQQQQQPPQVLQAYPNKQPGLAPVFPLDLLKRDSTPALVTDSHGNHFLIALTSHITGNQKNNTAEGKAANHIMLQRLQSAPATLPGRDPVQPPRAYNQSQESICMDFQKEQNTNEVDSSLDVLFSPLSPASVKTTASSPDNKDREHEADFIDIILQTGETSTALKPAAVADPSPDHLYPVSAASSPPPSTLHLLSSPPIPASCHTTQPALLVQTELLTEEKPHLSSTGSGRLEDFLESTTGKPLLGVEPGGLLTLIDDLHSQMLCTPSILDHPPSPMDTLDMAAEPQQGLDSMDWLDLSMGGERGEETPTMGPQSPPGVFSTDFLDSYDLQIPWDSCL